MSVFVALTTTDAVDVDLGSSCPLHLSVTNDLVVFYDVADIQLPAHPTLSFFFLHSAPPSFSSSLFVGRVSRV